MKIGEMAGQDKGEVLDEDEPHDEEPGADKDVGADDAAVSAHSIALL